MNDPRLQGGGQAQPDNRATQVSIVTDMVRLPLECQNRPDEKQDGIKPGRNGNRHGKQNNTSTWKQKDVAENQAANSAGSTVSLVLMMPVNPQRKRAATQYRSEIDQQEFL